MVRISATTIMTVSNERKAAKSRCRRRRRTHLLRRGDATLSTRRFIDKRCSNRVVETFLPSLSHSLPTYRHIFGTNHTTRD